jgi:hypothetical protein
VTADNTSLSVILEQSQRSLEGVVITGYATQNKRQGGRFHRKIIGRRSEVNTSWLIRQGVTGKNSRGIITIAERAARCCGCSYHSWQRVHQRKQHLI